jgi:phosphotransferase system  glucose/maltose/N-acetylglucosamine-specific IIC component
MSIERRPIIAIAFMVFVALLLGLVIFPIIGIIGSVGR